MADDEVKPPIADGRERVLTARELATIRASLRLWIETPSAFISEQSYLDAGDEAPLEDDDVEQLIALLQGGPVRLVLGAARSISA